MITSSDRSVVGVKSNRGEPTRVRPYSTSGHKEAIVTAFRQRFLAEYGPEVTDTVFYWTSLVYFGDRPDKAMRGHSKDGHPEECEVTVGVAQLAKPLGVSTVIFDACANSKAVLDAIVENEKHCLTRKRFNKSDDAILAGFSEDSRECIDHERGDYCCKCVFPSRVNHCFFSGELRDQERKGVKKRARKKLKEAKDLEKDLTRGKKLKKRYWIDNVPIKATVSLPTKLSEIHDSDDFGDVSTILGRYRTFRGCSCFGGDPVRGRAFRPENRMEMDVDAESSASDVILVWLQM